VGVSNQASFLNSFELAHKNKQTRSWSRLSTFSDSGRVLQLCKSCANVFFCRTFDYASTSVVTHPVLASSTGQLFSHRVTFSLERHVTLMQQALDVRTPPVPFKSTDEVVFATASITSFQLASFIDSVNTSFNFWLITTLFVHFADGQPCNISCKRTRFKITSIAHTERGTKNSQYKTSEPEI